MGLSAFVLARTLVPARLRLEEILAELSTAENPRFVLAELHDFLVDISLEEWDEVLGEVDVSALPDFLSNYVAAMIEMAAERKGVKPPEELRAIPVLKEPYFATSLPGLRLHLLRTAPVPFRRRNLFIDSTVGDRV